MITPSTPVAPGFLQSSQVKTCPTGRSDSEFPASLSPEWLHIARMTVLKSKLILHTRAERIINNISLWWNVRLIFREGLSFLAFFFFSFLYRFSSEFSSWKFKDAWMKGKKILCQTKETGKMLYLLLLFMTCYKERKWRKKKNTRVFYPQNYWHSFCLFLQKEWGRPVCLQAGNLMCEVYKKRD